MLLSTGILIALSAFAGVLLFAVTDSGLSLWAAILLALVAVGAISTVIALALCRAAAAGDRSQIDARRAVAREWAKGQRRGAGLRGTRPMTEI